MDDFICVGKFINTFGIKGELKLLSNFEYLDKILITNFPIYIGPNKEKETIDSVRIHKNYPMILFKGYQNINEVLKYKGSLVYVKRNELNLSQDEYLLSDLIGFKVFDNLEELGIVIDYKKSSQTLLKIKGSKTFYLPLINEYIKEVNILKKVIITNNGKDLII